MMISTFSILIIFELMIKIQSRTFHNVSNSSIDRFTIAFLSFGHRRRSSVMRLIGCRLGTKTIKVESRGLESCFCEMVSSELPHDYILHSRFTNNNYLWPHDM